MKYRVSTYRDGNGVMIYRPEKWALWWPFWSKITVYDSPYTSCVIEFDIEMEAVEWVKQRVGYIASLKRQRVRNRVA